MDTTNPIPAEYREHFQAWLNHYCRDEEDREDTVRCVFSALRDDPESINRLTWSEMRDRGMYK